MCGVLTSGCTQMALTQGAILSAVNCNTHNLRKKQLSTWRAVKRLRATWGWRWRVGRVANEGNPVTGQCW